MSYLQAIAKDGKTDEQRYDEFTEYMFKDGVIEKALEAEDYDGEYPGIIQEKIAADMTTVGMAYDPNDKTASVERHRAMTLRNGIDKEVRGLCKSLDGMISYELSEEDVKAIKELELKEDEIEDKIFVRPFCLYQIDVKHMYKKDLQALPEDPVVFAKLALEHEMDCTYEDSDDEDWVDDGEDEDEDESDDDDDEESGSGGSDSDEAEDEKKAVEDAGSKGKGKAAADEDEEHEEEEHEHEHGEHCSHSHDIVDIDEELPFDESEVSVNAASDGLKLLGEHKDKVVEMLENTTGLSIDSFKSYHFPGRHYIVAWVGDFAVYGIRISYPMLIDDSDAEDASDDEDEDDD
ncbi:hypothetical protein H4217_001535 [Coemansia sp. RSA 1939]|nr:hypothetical protein H4217_001535 [Coemansia sp. RSA 1939]KAJ2614595.1 hypothetical protein EV177_001995 [Coemansia sp. RSA 1804]KAJ2692654.1 hypothetical protein GGH99_001598 [Coemansia sp. RSA 1285]